MYNTELTEAKFYFQNSSKSNTTTCALPPLCSEYRYNSTLLQQFSGELATYGTKGFLVDFGFNKTLNQKMISALKKEQWLDHNTRAVAITWTVATAWSNANFMITILVENPGNNVFVSSYKI